MLETHIQSLPVTTPPYGLGGRQPLLPLSFLMSKLQGSRHTQSLPVQRGLFLRDIVGAKGGSPWAQPSNFFLRPSIPLSASMFLRQSPTSRFSWR